jgi:hypothetical protein
LGTGSSWWYSACSPKLKPCLKRRRKRPRLKRFVSKLSATHTKVTKSVKPWIGAGIFGVFAITWAVGIAIGIFISHPIYLGFVSLPVAVLAAMFFFTRIASSAAYVSIEGQMGAAASVLMAIRKGWITTPAVAVTKNQDMVHRSIGRAGIVLTGEGTQAVRGMLQDERRKAERFAPGVPVIEIYVGDGRGPSTTS